MSPNLANDHPIKVAIVGSGLAGLTTAYLLARAPRIQVEIFEVASSPSLDSASITLKDARDDSLHRVDLPMRSFAGGYYENLRRLYDHIGVKYTEQQFLFSFARANSTPSIPEKVGLYSSGVGKKDTFAEDSHDTTYFHHPSNLVHFPSRPTGTPLTQHVTRCIYLLLNYIYFTLCVFFFPPRESDDLGQYLERIWLPALFCESYLLPLLSAVSTCSHKSLLAAPATDVVGYKRLTHRKRHLSVLGGVSEAQGRLLEACERTGRVKLWVARKVVSVKLAEGGNGVEVCWAGVDDAQGGGFLDADSVADSKRFDQVVLATPPNVVGKVYHKLRSEMSDIPTTQVTSVVVQPRETGGRTNRFSVVKADAAAGKPHWELSTRVIMAQNGRGLEEENITLRTNFRTGWTEAAHRIPCGATVTTCPLDRDSTNESHDVIRQVTFTRVLRTVGSRRVVNRLFKPRRNLARNHEEEHKDQKRRGLMDADEAMDKHPWHNGDDGVYLVGGWCWDGMVLLEGCVVSALRVAREFGVDVPWE
ncbi:FAD/NAD(P)-binding domain-containing protein [Zalerion maritima]|uniref:FAD/NAD(P)-binding domain-containing protein n=1 Tax=Zalerion maritima TaxID=339359 RepID=A0AAD5RR38_9PEZI|nr:FAD/NAD(P)-binding domain-containing protein [Zalerion maritima]